MKCHVCKIIIPTLVIFGLLLYGGSRFLPPLAPNHITIAAGEKSGIYYQSALAYQALLAKQKIDTTIISTHGSVEALGLLRAHKADIAFVQSGSTDAFADAPFTALASIYNEPVWVYYPSDRGALRYLSELKGKRIAVGPEGSGTKALALKLLKANGVTAQNSTLLSLGNNAGAQALFDGEADALFSVIGTFAPLTKALLLDPDIKLLNFTRTRAYAVRYPYLNAVKLDQGVMDLENNLPPHTKQLIAATAMLVSREEIHPDIVRLVLQAAKKVHGNAGIFRKAGEFPTAARVEFPLNVDAEVYLRDGETFLERIFPFWIASTIKRLVFLLIPVIALMIPVMKILPSLVTWRSRWKIYRWYKTLNLIESGMNDFDAQQRRDAVNALEQELQKIQKVDVPLSYRREYYDLIQHFELVLNRLSKPLKSR